MSGAQKWSGKSDSLKKKAVMVRITARIPIGLESRSGQWAMISARNVECIIP